LKKSDLIDVLKKELKNLGWFIVILYIFLQAWHFKDSPFNVLKVIFAQLYLFILPGFMLMLYFRDEIEFIYRLLIGIALGYSASILLTIYLNVAFRVNIGYLYWISPLILIAFGLFIFIKKK